MSPRRPLHPDDARALITDWCSRTRASKAEFDARTAELPGLIELCVEAGLKQVEIATLARLSRQTIHRYARKAGA